MNGFFAIVGFILAHYLDKKMKDGWEWIVPLIVALIASMLLYASGLSVTVSAWLEMVVGGLAGAFGGMTGEGLPTTVVMSVIAFGAFLVTIFDLWKDHKYNAKARNAMIIAPIAAHGAGGWVGTMIDSLHSAGADMAMGIVNGMFG